MKSRLLLASIGLAVLTFFSLALTAGENGKKDDPARSRDDIATVEQQLSRKFADFEQSLLKLKQRMERSAKREDQDKAKVLGRVLDECKNVGVQLKFEKLVSFLRSNEFGNIGNVREAKDQSEQIAQALQRLIALLSEDSSLEDARNKSKALEKFIKDIEAAILKQQGVEAQTQLGKTDTKELQDAQNRLKKETDKIAAAMEKFIKGNDKGGEAKNSKGDNKDPGKEGEAKAGETKDKGGEEKAASTKDAGKDGEGKKGEAKSGDDKGKEGDPKEGGAEAKPGDMGKEGNAKEGSAKDSKSGEAKAGDPKGKEGGKEGAGKEGEAKAGDPKAGDPGAAKPGEKKNPEAGKPSAGKPGEAKAGDKGKEGAKDGAAKDSKGGEAKAGDPKAGGKPSEGKQGEAKKGDDAKGQSEAKSDGAPKEGGKAGEPGQAKDGGQPPPGGPQGPPKDKDEIAQSKKKIEEAGYDQAKAADKIAKKDNPNATENQKDAIKNLGDAKKQLEKLLRQMREEELDRVLAALQARCEKMLAMQKAVLAGTEATDKSVQANADKKASDLNKRESLRLADAEKDIVAEANKAIEMLEAEGSAVAFPEVFQQVRQDMVNVQRRLEIADVAQMTQNIERDIIASLEEMVEALKKARQENQQGPPPPPKDGSPPPPPPDQKLLDQIAELKMIRSLQIRVNERTKTYGRNIQGEQAADPIIQRELNNLADRQERIYDITRKIAKGDNK